MEDMKMTEMQALFIPASKRQRPTVFSYMKNGKKHWGIRFFDVGGEYRQDRLGITNKTLARDELSKRKNEVLLAGQAGKASVKVETKGCPTLKEYAEDYLKERKAELGKQTHQVYDCYLQKHIIPALGAKHIDQITPGMVQSFKSDRLASGAASATVVKDLMILSGIFRMAENNEIVTRNPVRLTKKPKVRNTIVRWLSETEETAILSQAARYPNSLLRSAIIFAIHSGLREQEQCQLPWADVNFDRRIITIRDTKNGDDREVDMSETLYQLLLKIPTRFNCAYVFTNGKTKKPYKCFNNTLWRKVLRNAGVKGLRWHDLRHTFGSRLRQRGVPLETIAELMGHKSLAMTLRYAHLDSASRSDAVRRLDQRPAVPQPADQPKAANQ